MKQLLKSKNVTNILLKNIFYIMPCYMSYIITQNDDASKKR